MITKQGIRAYENFVDKQYSPRGRAYYWIAGNSGPHDAQPGSDGYALISHYVSVTPVNLDLTCDEMLRPLEARKVLLDGRLAALAGVRGTFGRPAGAENVKSSENPVSPKSRAKTAVRPPTEDLHGSRRTSPAKIMKDRRTGRKPEH